MKPVPGCLRQVVSFYPGQLTKSRNDRSRLGDKLILDGQLVRVWRGGMAVPVDDPWAELSETDITREMRRGINSAGIVSVYRLGPTEIRERFGYELTQNLFVLETK
ncbi:hypothetical protein [Candidatus Palauibacter sp.]|uniref:hypothetical protein n=1 Tax=Candidatus Palauibacter sp. TaxID=3101350 RepID=UPI003CC54730